MYSIRVRFTRQKNSFKTNYKQIKYKAGQISKLYVDFYPPKSSKETFSGGIPQSSVILMTA